MCLIGSKVSLPSAFAVPSPSLYAASAWQYSCSVSPITIPGREYKVSMMSKCIRSIVLHFYGAGNTRAMYVRDKRRAAYPSTALFFNRNIILYRYNKKSDFFIYGFQFLNSDFFTYPPIHYIVINYNEKIIIDKSKKRTYHIVNVYCHGSRHYAV